MPEKDRQENARNENINYKKSTNIRSQLYLFNQMLIINSWKNGTENKKENI